MSDPVLITIITGVFVLATAYVNVRVSRNSERQKGLGVAIAELATQLDAVNARLRRERLTWHWWARQVVAYLRTLDNGEEIAAGLPPMPGSLKEREAASPREPRTREK